jgi:death-on-curing protein
MIRYLTVDEVLDLHEWVIEASGGSLGLRDLGALESSVAQPQMAFAGQDLYPSLGDKAAALAFSLIQNHPFVDGNKRVGHAAMETFLVLNGQQILAEVDEQEQLILAVAASQMDRQTFATWVRDHLRPWKREQ